MRLTRLLSVLLLFVVAGGVIAQAPAPSPELALSHFVGTWTGVGQNFTATPTETVPLTVVVTQETHSKHPALHMEYTYGTKGTKTYDHITRYLWFDPAKSQVVFEWKHAGKDVFEARGLETFFASGYGSFTVANVVLEARGDAYYHGLFMLGPQTWTYSWERSTDGKVFTKRSDWTLTRQP